MTRPRVLPLALLLLALAPGCDKAKTNEYAPPPPPEVTVAAPLAKSVTAYRVYSGTTEASEVVDVRARVQGFLRQVHFQPGQLVKEGDLLFCIEPEEFEARVAQAEASVASAKAAFDLASVTLEKYQIAFDQGGMTELEVKEKIAARDQAQAAVELAEAQLVRASLDLSYCNIHSPVTGRITKNLVDQGNLVGQGEATLLATIYATAPIFVTVDAPEDVVLQFRRRLTPHYREGIEPGQTPDGEWRTVQLAVADEKGFPHAGRIDFVDPSLDPTTGTLRVRVRFENEDSFLIPGLFSRVRLPGDAFDAILVPDDALNSDQQGRFALVVNAENMVEARRVETGPMEGNLRVVRSGLTPQDRVIISGLMRARPGAVVTPKPGVITSETTTAPEQGAAQEG